MEFPEELDLISVFGAIPKRKDETDAFYYDTSTFVLENEKEIYEIILSPFYHEFTLSVKEKKTNKVCHILNYFLLIKLKLWKKKGAFKNSFVSR
ncbi:hypothetical protein [Peribacillus sp. TH27]|uniref:hypothetical protein n=1 Tax=Peribacillus sp. TH27 TaxID=2798484 RepID=UPI001911BA9A|nr:hypothetical protein [Peribacillus sp. TH27]MBK5459140.1 hypothetical protein [Peribacillus sp. TH27]